MKYLYIQMPIGITITVACATALLSSLIAEVVKFYCGKSSCHLVIDKEKESESSD